MLGLMACLFWRGKKNAKAMPIYVYIILREYKLGFYHYIPAKHGLILPVLKMNCAS